MKKPPSQTQQNDSFDERITQLEIEDAVQSRITSLIRTICITSTTAVISFFVWLGSITYDKFPAFKAAIIAFIQTDKGIK